MVYLLDNVLQRRDDNYYICDRSTHRTDGQTTITWKWRYQSIKIIINFSVIQCCGAGMLLNIWEVSRKKSWWRSGGGVRVSLGWPSTLPWQPVRTRQRSKGARMNWWVSTWASHWGGGWSGGRETNRSWATKSSMTVAHVSCKLARECIVNPMTVS